MWWLCVCLDVKGFQLFDMPAAVPPECRNSAVQHLAEGVRALAGNARTHAACAARAVHMAGLIRAACWRCLPTCRQTPALQVEFGIDSSRDALASFRANTSHSAAAPFNAVTGRPPADLPPLKVRVRLTLAAQLHLSAADGCRVIAMLWFRMATDCNLSIQYVEHMQPPHLHRPALRRLLLPPARWSRWWRRPAAGGWRCLLWTGCTSARPARMCRRRSHWSSVCSPELS